MPLNIWDPKSIRNASLLGIEALTGRTDMAYLVCTFSGLGSMDRLPTGPLRANGRDRHSGLKRIEMGTILIYTYPMHLKYQPAATKQRAHDAERAQGAASTRDMKLTDLKTGATARVVSVGSADAA